MTKEIIIILSILAGITLITTIIYIVVAVKKKSYLVLKDYIQLLFKKGNVKKNPLSISCNKVNVETAAISCNKVNVETAAISCKRGNICKKALCNLILQERDAGLEHRYCANWKSTSQLNLLDFTNRINGKFGSKDGIILNDLIQMRLNENNISACKDDKIKKLVIMITEEGIKSVSKKDGHKLFQAKAPMYKGIKYINRAIPLQEDA